MLYQLVLLLFLLQWTAEQFEGEKREFTRQGEAFSGELFF